MTRAKQQTRETKTQELSQPELTEVTGGIIAVLPQKAQMGDGSVRPVTPQAEKGLIGLL